MIKARKPLTKAQAFSLRFDVLKKLSKNIGVSWDKMPSSSVIIHQAALCYTPECSNIYRHGRENVKSCMLLKMCRGGRKKNSQGKYLCQDSNLVLHDLKIGALPSD